MKHQAVIIGGGSAGLAAAIALYKRGIKDILILERDLELGGILQQCIHNGFGLHTFNEELSGPAYAERYINELEKLGIKYRLNSMVIDISSEKVIQYVNPTDGYQIIQAEAIILAMGCYERTRGSIAIPGYRPTGIYCAGIAQRYLNMEGYLVGKKVFILGSGDIGLIMARRMILEGAQVLGVAELMPYSNGLSRNVVQCLDDFKIPLFLSHTVTEIKGHQRVESITISQVDDKFKPIGGTEKQFNVDTLLLSVGLIPENGLSEKAKVELHPKTKGAIVNESYMSSIAGIFACGNVLHVHDLVDFVSLEGERAAIGVVRYLNKELDFSKAPIEMINGEGINYVLPHKIYQANVDDDVELFFRVNRAYKKCKIIVVGDGEIVQQITKMHMLPAEMEKIKINRAILSAAKKYIKISIEEA